MPVCGSQSTDQCLLCCLSGFLGSTVSQTRQTTNGSLSDGLLLVGQHLARASSRSPAKMGEAAAAWFFNLSPFGAHP